MSVPHSPRSLGADTTAAAEVVDGVDLHGRRAVVTGAGSGIGVETARALASAGADVTLAVRDPEPTPTPVSRRTPWTRRTRPGCGPCPRTWSVDAGDRRAYSSTSSDRRSR